jgi:hypothetical protein
MLSHELMQCRIDATQTIVRSIIRQSFRLRQRLDDKRKSPRIIDRAQREQHCSQRSSPFRLLELQQKFRQRGFADFC